MRLEGRVIVLLDNGSEHGPEHGPMVARALAEAGASVVTVHGQGRPPEGRGHLAGDPSDPIDVETAKSMAAELFGPVDGVIDTADVAPDPDGVVTAVESRLQAQGPEPEKHGRSGAAPSPERAPFAPSVGFPTEGPARTN